MNVFHRVAQRSMRANRMRTIVTIIGVILSAAMFTAVTTFATTLLTHLQRVTAYLDGAYYLGVHNVDADTLAPCGPTVISRLFGRRGARLCRGHGQQQQ